MISILKSTNSNSVELRLGIEYSQGLAERRISGFASGDAGVHGSFTAAARAARGPRRSALLRGRESVETRMRRVRTHAQLRPQGISIAITKATPADRRQAEQPRRGVRRPTQLTPTPGRGDQPSTGPASTRPAGLECKDHDVIRGSRYSNLLLFRI